MGRQARVEYAGAIYHVMSRGNHQQPIFRTEEDCKTFLDLVGKVCERTGWVVHAYVLMGNHYHLLIETPEANLVSGMRWLQSTYTKRFNMRHKEWGHLFQGRYKALVVDGSSGNYFLTVATYIHLNPVRVKGIDLEKRSLIDHVWSSYPAYLDLELRSDWLCVDRVLGCLGFNDSPAGRCQLQTYMEARVSEVSSSKNPLEANDEWKEIRRGWYIGDKEFRAELLERMDSVLEGKRRDSFSGASIRMHDEREAEELVKAALIRLGLQDDDLTQMRKSDDRKKVIAWKVRRATSVKNEWISTRLIMGNSSNLSRYVAQVEEEKEGCLYELKATI